MMNPRSVAMAQRYANALSPEPVPAEEVRPFPSNEELVDGQTQMVVWETDTPFRARIVVYGFWEEHKRPHEILGNIELGTTSIARASVREFWDDDKVTRVIEALINLHERINDR